MEFDVPGLSPEQLEVMAHEGALILRGSRSEREQPAEIQTLFAERPSGEFERQLRLPKTADLGNIIASHAHGVLTIRVGKLATMAPRKIAINSGESVQTPAAGN